MGGWLPSRMVTTWPKNPGDFPHAITETEEYSHTCMLVPYPHIGYPVYMMRIEWTPYLSTGPDYFGPVHMDVPEDEVLEKVAALHALGFDVSVSII